MSWVIIGKSAPRFWRCGCESRHLEQIGVSSKGKTRVFGAWNIGSIPITPAKFDDYRLVNVVKLDKLDLLEAL